jgi:hypothetical protein
MVSNNPGMAAIPQTWRIAEVNFPASVWRAEIAMGNL